MPLHWDGGYEYIDWGVIVGSADHDVVTNLSLGYGTMGSSAAFRYRVYDSYSGYCTGLGNNVLDVSFTGLPGTVSTTGATGWIVSLDLRPTGACFYLPEGTFGYSYTFVGDSQTGPLMATGGSGNVCDCDVDPSSGCYTLSLHLCLSWWTELYAHDGNDTFPGGCGGGLALETMGPTCSGSTVAFEVSGASVGDWWALALGSTVGPGVGGSVGGCPIDVVPIVPIVVIGQLSVQPLTLPATVNLLPGVSLAIQAITKNPGTNSYDSSNTEIVYVP